MESQVRGDRAISDIASLIVCKKYETKDILKACGALFSELFLTLNRDDFNTYTQEIIDRIYVLRAHKDKEEKE